MTTLWAVPHNGSAVGPWADDLRSARRLADGPRPARGITAAAYYRAVAWWGAVSDPATELATPVEQ
jgi:hypothetical protein